MALNNKEDTLTQSQILKAQDAPSFIEAQQQEIKGLEAMNIFDYQPIQSLPANACLFSSI
jgi:hypothetical protein